MNFDVDRLRTYNDLFPHFRLSDLYQAYGGNGKEVRGEETNKTTSRYGKTGDIYSLVSNMFVLQFNFILQVIQVQQTLSHPRRLRDS